MPDFCFSINNIHYLQYTLYPSLSPSLEKKPNKSLDPLETINRKTQQQQQQQPHPFFPGLFDLQKKTRKTRSKPVSLSKIQLVALRFSRCFSCRFFGDQKPRALHAWPTSQRLVLRYPKSRWFEVSKVGFSNGKMWSTNVGGWTFQPIWKTWGQNGFIFPNFRGENKKNETRT